MVVGLVTVSVGPIQSCCAFVSTRRCRYHEALSNDLHSSALLVDNPNASNDTRSILPHVQIYQKPMQIRRIPTKRKPRFYWQSTTNLCNELALFWEQHSVPIDKLKPPIPSEHLLNYFKRNDLRGAIASYGGRERVSTLLGGAKIIPGRWKDALEMEEVKCLLPLMNEMGLEESILPQQSGIAKREKVAKCSALNMKYDVNEQLTLVDLMQQTANQTAHFETTGPKSEFWNKEKAVLKL